MRFPRSGATRVAATVLTAAALLTAAAACNDSEPTAPPTMALSPIVVNAATVLGTTGTIVSHLSATKCIDASHATATTIGPTVLATCSTSAAQQFKWETNGTISTFGGKMCLDDEGGKGTNYDRITVYPCHNAANQHWARNSIGEIVGINGKCIDVYGAKTTVGTPIILYTCKQTANQEWDVKTSTTAPPPTTTGITLSKVSGDNQKATYGTSVAAPLVVLAKNSKGLPAANVKITWKGTDGTPSALSSVTTSTGRAQITFKISSLYFISKATATAGTSSVTFSAFGNGTPNLQGRRPFPASNPWNTDISAAPVDPNSAALIASCGGTRQLHPDFGTVWDGAPNGIPFIVVHSSQPKSSVTFHYASESDKGPYPLPSNVPIEGTSATSGDRHSLVIDGDVWKDYELFALVRPTSTTGWKAGSGAIFDLTLGTTRPAGWTSADAAGLPIFPGLVRYDEAVQRKLIQHALRMSCDKTRWAYIAPARHAAGDGTSTNLPPMGMRVRLKKNVDISQFSATDQVILRALQHYGAFVADDGVGFMISGAPDPRWSDDDLHKLTRLTGNNFEVVKMGPVTNVAH